MTYICVYSFWSSPSLSNSLVWRKKYFLFYFNLMHTQFIHCCRCIVLPPWSWCALLLHVFHLWQRMKPCVCLYYTFLFSRSSFYFLCFVCIWYALFFFSFLLPFAHKDQTKLIRKNNNDLSCNKWYFCFRGGESRLCNASPDGCRVTRSCFDPSYPRRTDSQYAVRGHTFNPLCFFLLSLLMEVWCSIPFHQIEMGL